MTYAVAKRMAAERSLRNRSTLYVLFSSFNGYDVASEDDMDTWYAGENAIAVFVNGQWES